MGGGIFKMINEKSVRDVPWRYKVSIAVICSSLFFTGFFPIPSAGADESVDVEELIAKSPVAYRFVDHLSGAETAILFGGKKSQAGVWKKDRFVFAPHGENAEIKIVTLTINGQKEQGIFLYFYPRRKTTRWIRFRNVPVGQRLSLDYGMLESNASGAPKTGDAEPAFVSLRVWVGRHEMKRIQGGGEKGWKKTQLDLGMASFLKRNLTLTFELTADSTEPHRVVFGGEILK